MATEKNGRASTEEISLLAGVVYGGCCGLTAYITSVGSHAILRIRQQTQRSVKKPLRALKIMRTALPLQSYSICYKISFHLHHQPPGPQQRHRKTYNETEECKCMNNNHHRHLFAIFHLFESLAMQQLHNADARLRKTRIVNGF